jgi:hypothetical protein
MEQGFTYAVSVFTGTKSGAGTDANVHLEMWDALGVSSGRHILRASKTHTNKFENGNCDVFHVTLPKALDAISKLLIGHDNKGIAGNAWFLDHVEVIALSTNENPTTANPEAPNPPVVFPCFRWLIHPDLEAMLSPGVLGPIRTYTVRIWTGNEPECGTDANVRIELLGAGGVSSGVHRLAKSFDHVDKFERGHYDTFKLEVPMELGELVSVKIYSDIDKDHWLLNKIVVWDHYACAASCNTPGVAADEISWADVSNSVLKGDHPHRWLFPLKSWITSSESVIIDAAPVNSSVDRKQADGFSDEPALISYEVAIFTGDLKDASASGPVSIKLIGSKSTSHRQLLKLTSSGSTAKFQRGGYDMFSVATVKDLGVINSVWVSHDPGIALFGSAAWYLDYIVVKLGQGEGVRFNCQRWLDKVSREVTLQPLSSEHSSPPNADLDVAALRSQIENDNQVIAQLRIQIEGGALQNDELQKQMRELTVEHQAQNEVCTKEIQNLRLQVSELQALLSRSPSAAASSPNADLDVAALRSQIENDNQVIAQLRIQIEGGALQNDELQKQMRELTVEHQAQNEVCTKEIQNLRLQVSELQALLSRSPSASEPQGDFADQSQVATAFDALAELMQTIDLPPVEAFRATDALLPTYKKMVHSYTDAHKTILTLLASLRKGWSCLSSVATFNPSQAMPQPSRGSRFRAASSPNADLDVAALRSQIENGNQVIAQLRIQIENGALQNDELQKQMRELTVEHQAQNEVCTKEIQNLRLQVSELQALLARSPSASEPQGDFADLFEGDAGFPGGARPSASGPQGDFADLLQGDAVFSRGVWSQPA